MKSTGSRLEDACKHNGRRLIGSAEVCSASYVSWQRDTARSCCWAPAVQQSIDISCPPGAQQQTRRTLLQRSINETVRRTDRRTPNRYPDTAAYSAISVSIAVLVGVFITWRLPRERVRWEASQQLTCRTNASAFSVLCLSWPTCRRVSWSSRTISALASLPAAAEDGDGDGDGDVGGCWLPFSLLETSPSLTTVFVAVVLLSETVNVKANGV